MWMSRWLERSKAMPVTILLDDRTWALKSNLRVSGNITLDMMKEILGLLEDCMHRLHRLDIRVRLIPYEPMSQILSKATQLQQLSLCQWSGERTWFNGPSQGNSFSWLEQKPSLIRLRFQGLSLPYTTHLTSLDVHDLQLTYSDVQALFGANCCLKHLVLHNLYPIPLSRIPAQDSPMRVDSLCSIAISSDRAHTGARQAGYLFPLLDMPNVTYLELDCDVGFSVMFGKSLSAAKIDTLKIANRLPISFPSHSAESNDDIQTIQSFSNLRRLELTRVSTKLLLDKPASIRPSREVTRQRSIGSRMGVIRRATRIEGSTNGPSIATTWPGIRSILLDTAIAEDIVSLIVFIQCHKDVHTIELSTLAMRHLAFLKRKGDAIISIPYKISIRKSGFDFDDSEEGVTQDVEQWLSNMVDLKPISVLDNLLLKDADPLLQLP